MVIFMKATRRCFSKKITSIIACTLILAISLCIFANATITTGKHYPYCGVGFVQGKCEDITQTKNGQSLGASCLGGTYMGKTGTETTGLKYVEVSTVHSIAKMENCYSSMDTTDYLTGKSIASLSASRNTGVVWDGDAKLNNKLAEYTRKISVFGCSEAYWNGYSYILYPTVVNV